jgi:hypothetical protein
MKTMKKSTTSKFQIGGTTTAQPKPKAPKRALTQAEKMDLKEDYKAFPYPRKYFEVKPSAPKKEAPIKKSPTYKKGGLIKKSTTLKARKK